jgi:hypothetical protein
MLLELQLGSGEIYVHGMCSWDWVNSPEAGTTLQLEYAATEPTGLLTI